MSVLLILLRLLWILAKKYSLSSLYMSY